MVLDGVGNLYVAVDNLTLTTGYIEKIAPGGGAGAGSLYSTSGVGLRDPSGITFDGSGNLYVTDIAATGVNSIDKINSSGVVSNLYTESAAGGNWGDIRYFSGTLYVSDYTDNMIFSLPVGGGTLATYSSSGDLNAPLGLAVDSTGDLYTANVTDIAEIAPGGGAATSFVAPSGAETLEYVAIATPVSIPEPSSWGLLLCGGAYFGFAWRRRGSS